MDGEKVLKVEQSKRIAIVGTRSRNTPEAFKVILEKFWQIYEEGDWIISGGCPKGGDRFAEQIAKAEGIPILIIYPAYKKYKMGAPIIRNGLVGENSDVVIACVRRPEDDVDAVLSRTKGGTEDMLRKFKKLNPTGKIYLV